MRRILSLLTLALVCSLALPSAQSASRASEDRLVGSWAGTYDGSGTGKYTMVVARDAAKKLGGSLEARPDDGDGYKATFKTVAVDGAKVKIAYDTPDGDGTEVQLEATVDGTSLKGNWKVVDPSKNVLESGTFVGMKS